MKQRVFLVTAIIIILFAVMMVSLRANQESINVQKEILSKAEIVLLDGTTEKILNLDNITSVGEENFEAILDTSDTEASLHDYTGVQLKNILKKENIDLVNKKAVIISAVDGFSVAYSVDEIMTDGNVYIAYMEDGNFLKRKEDRGRGPYESIVVQDQFSNRRCKWITKIEVN